MGLHGTNILCSLFNFIAQICVRRHHTDFIQYHFNQMKKISLQGSSNLKDPTNTF